MRHRSRYMGTPRIFWFKPTNKKLLFLHGSLAWIILEKMPFLGERLFKLYVDERFIEYPFVYSVIGLDGKLRILDVGCCGSNLAIALASLGHEVCGIDIRDYLFKHPYFSFVRGDILGCSFRESSFDIVTAISTIEHVGLGRYKDPFCTDGDKKAMKEIARILKVGGKAIIAVPFGRSDTVYLKGGPSHIIYDSSSLEKLSEDFRIVKEFFWVRRDECWLLATKSEAERVKSEATDIRSIAMLELEKLE